jgi:hypothetical protein
MAVDFMKPEEAEQICDGLDDEVYSFNDIIELVEKSIFLENKDTDDGYYHAQGQLILLKRLADSIYGDGNHMDELNVLYEHIDHKLSDYYESLGLECIDDLYDMYDV